MKISKGLSVFYNFYENITCSKRPSKFWVFIEFFNKETAQQNFALQLTSSSEKFK